MRKVALTMRWRPEAARERTVCDARVRVAQRLDGRGIAGPRSSVRVIGRCTVKAVRLGTLLIGVIARYVFRSPLMWTDELAQAVFLWLGMIGAIVALNRGEHMRMTALVVRAAPRPRQGLEAFAAGAGLVFLAAVIQPAIEYVQEVTRIEMSGLGVSKAWLTAPLPCGFAMMLVVGVIRLFRVFPVGMALALIAVAAAAAVFAPMADPWLESLGNLNLILFFIGLVGAAVLAGVPIAIAFAVGTFAYMVLTTDVPMLLFVGRFYEGMSHLILLAVPLFVFLGLLIEMTGMARAMVDFLASLLGHIRGGLSYVLVGAMYLVSGISGSKAADMAAVAPALFPEMIKRGAAPGDLVALLSATGAQTETVPPSLVLITIGSVTGVSIGALFTGGLLPSLVLAVGLCLVVRRRYRNQDMSGIRRATIGRGGTRLLHRGAGAGAAIRHSLHGRGGRGDRDRGVHHRHRLHDRRRPADLPPVQLVADRADAGGNRVAVRRDSADPRCRDGDGMGADAVRLLAATGDCDDRPAGRQVHIPGGVDRRLRGAGQRAGGNSGDRAVRPLAVPDRGEAWHPRGSLRHGHSAGDGHRAVRPAIRCGFLCRRCHWSHRSQPRHPADHGLPARHAGRLDRGGGHPLGVDRISVISGFRRLLSTLRSRSLADKANVGSRPSRDIPAAPADGRTGQKAVVRARPPPMLTTGSRQFVEQHLCVFQAAGVEALGEPAVNRGEEVAGLGAAALLAPQPGEIAGGAQFQRFCSLGLGDADRLLKGGPSSSLFSASSTDPVSRCSSASHICSPMVRAVSNPSRSAASAAARSPGHLPLRETRVKVDPPGPPNTLTVCSSTIGIRISNKVE